MIRTLVDERIPMLFFFNCVYLFSFYTLSEIHVNRYTIDYTDLFENNIQTFNSKFPMDLNIGQIKLMLTFGPG